MIATILIIGATGVFGSRLASHLARTSDYRLLLASRSYSRSRNLAERLIARPGTTASVEPIALDTTSGIEAALAAAQPDLVVDCSGPFQSMDYRVPLAAAAAGAHFVDLADGRQYVLGFERALDAPFRSGNLVALTGASSSPALAAAAVVELTRDWKRVDHIDVAIVPGGRSEVGEAAVAAALSYCGKPVPVVAAGVLGQALGWGTRRHIDLPSVGNRTVASVETSDAELLQNLYPEATSIRFWAGLESPFEQWGMAAIAKLRRLGWLHRPERLAPLLIRARKLTRLMSGTTGAMSVRVIGLDREAHWTQAEWRLTARMNEGPQVPPSPAAAAIREILAGTRPPGARRALDIPLSAIEAELVGYAIETERVIETCDRCFVEEAIGNDQFKSLDTAVKAFHGIESPPRWTGRAEVQSATSIVGRIVARAVGFPPSGKNMPVKVVAERSLPLGTRRAVTDENWTRTFGNRSFVSKIAALGPGLTTERFGPITFAIGLNATGGALLYPVTGWRIGPLPLPSALATRSEAREWQDDQGRFNFDVRLTHPFLGMLAHYRGWLVPEIRQPPP